MKKVAVHIAEGFEEIEAISIIDVLRRAEISTTVVSVSSDYIVTGSHGIKILCDNLFENINYSEIDMIVLPGGMPGSANLNKHEELKKQILQFNSENKALAAICAAPMVFGNLGILKNKSATCYPGFENELYDAKVSTKNVEQSAQIITGKGAGVAIQFALQIVEFFKGKTLADELAIKMIVKRDL